ncbi:MAG: NAD(P)H-binding protein [Sphingobium sp.]|uniref:SDR family oxidoreductase n=1 Tax=Sphingobium sp. TaxID=1912891 RepID=UPI0029B4CB71|nr:NAD(P)H-binding protein [Sphingobium sp.]MDX3910315.1 NAD(P)H-binding protein [Sphingobium sp.]
MKILVIGASGKVGKPLVRELLAKGVSVRALTRSAERAASLDPRVEAVVADITGDPLSSRPAFQGIDAVFMLNQPTFQETAEGLLAVELARSAGVVRFVYQSVFRVDDLAYLPHVAPKLVIQLAVMGSGMGWTILSPNHFYQNDQMTQFSLLKRGEYSVPVGLVGCTSVDVSDIAAVAAVALTGSGHDGRNYPVVGPQLLNGEDCAAIWSEALGTGIRYTGDVEQWQQAARSVLPPWLSFDLGMMYRDFGRRGFVASECEIAQMQELLGRAPRRYEEHVASLAAEWTQDLRAAF